MFNFSRQGESLASVTPDNIRIPRNNERNKTPDSSFIRKEHIGDTVSPRKISQEDIVTDIGKGGLQKNTFTHSK